MIKLLKYSNTNTYLIPGPKGHLLFDTGWAGTFPPFCHALGEVGEQLQDIRYLLISHYHPDHCGIAQEIADTGARILALEEQRVYLHAADEVFAKEGRAEKAGDGARSGFCPIRDAEVRFLRAEESRAFLLEELGIEGEILATPGHSADSISLLLDSGELFVGDLNPLYELELHAGTQIARSWEMLLSKSPRIVYYGHAKAAVLEGKVAGGSDALGASAGKAGGGSAKDKEDARSARELCDLVTRIMKLIDKGKTLDTIARKTGADRTLIEDVTRMYLTHPGVSVQGILDRIEIKGR